MKELPKHYYLYLRLRKDVFTVADARRITMHGIIVQQIQPKLFGKID